jgi:hypothetical protein
MATSLTKITMSSTQTVSPSTSLIPLTVIKQLTASNLPVSTQPPLQSDAAPQINPIHPRKIADVEMVQKGSLSTTVMPTLIHLPQREKGITGLPDFCDHRRCPNDSPVFFSMYVNPRVVRKIGDAVSWYFKTTNLTDKPVEGPIDFYISGIEDDGPIATIQNLAPSSYYDLIVTDSVDELDILRRFIVATIWARIRSTGELIGNVVDAAVAVETLFEDLAIVEFANPQLLTSVGSDHVDVRASVDLINLSSMPVESLMVDLMVIFGTEIALSYLVNGQSSTMFIAEKGILTLAPRQEIAANARLAIVITNTDKAVSLFGYCRQICSSSAAWRLVGRATNTTALQWFAKESAPPEKSKSAPPAVADSIPRDKNVQSLVHSASEAMTGTLEHMISAGNMVFIEPPH